MKNKNQANVLRVSIRFQLKRQSYTYLRYLYKIYRKYSKKISFNKIKVNKKMNKFYLQFTSKKSVKKTSKFILL